MIAGARRRARRIGVPVSRALMGSASTGSVGMGGGGLAAPAQIDGMSGESSGRNRAWLGCIVAHGKASTPRAVGMRAGMGPDAPAPPRHPRQLPHQPLSGTSASNHGPLTVFPGGEPLSAGARS